MCKIFYQNKNPKSGCTLYTSANREKIKQNCIPIFNQKSGVCIILEYDTAILKVHLEPEEDKEKHFVVHLVLVVSTLALDYNGGCLDEIIVTLHLQKHQWCWTLTLGAV